jgi:hypothetical protein
MRKQLLVGLSIILLVIVAGISYVIRSATIQSPDAQQDHTSNAGAIEGRVVDANGQAVSYAEVQILKSDFTSGKIPTAYTDQAGVFSIKGLAAGTYTLSVSKAEDGYVDISSPFFSAGLVPAMQVNVKERETTADVTAYLGPKAAKLVGRVVDVSTKKPINDLQNVQITLRRVDNPDCSYSTGLDLDDQFVILVPPVPFTIEVSALGYEKRNLKALQLRQEEVKRLDISLRPVK